MYAVKIHQLFHFKWWRSNTMSLALYFKFSDDFRNSDFISLTFAERIKCSVFNLGRSCKSPDVRHYYVFNKTVILANFDCVHLLNDMMYQTNKRNKLNSLKVVRRTYNIQGFT